MILSNQRHCNDCGDTIFSMSQHHYVKCRCGKVMVDGGMSYKRSSVNGVDMSIEVSNEHVAGLVACAEDARKTPLGAVCNIARYLRDEMGINIGLPAPPPEPACSCVEVCDECKGEDDAD